MATWTTIANTAVDVDSPVTVSLVTALRDNPEAIAEGAAGAPKVVPAALNITLDVSTTTADGTIVTITGLGRVDNILSHYRFDVARAASGTGTGTYRYRTSTDGGSTWSGYTTIASLTVNASEASEIAFKVIDTSGSIDAVEYSITDLSLDTISLEHVVMGIQGTSP